MQKSSWGLSKKIWGYISHFPYACHMTSCVSGVGLDINTNMSREICRIEFSDYVISPSLSCFFHHSLTLRSNTLTSNILSLFSFSLKCEARFRTHTHTHTHTPHTHTHTTHTHHTHTHTHTHKTREIIVLFPVNFKFLFKFWVIVCMYSKWH